MFRVLLLFLIFNTLSLDSTRLKFDKYSDRFRNFLCDNGNYIRNFLKCNGRDDCGDNSDEDNCEDLEWPPRFRNCTKDEFQCRNTFCIPIRDFCNMEEDCPDGSDEYEGCETMLRQMPCLGFKCEEGICISNNWLCDGIQDCPNGSDEANCESTPVTGKNCNQTIERYLCNNTRCIPLNQTCDGKDDCGDGSDEGGDCKNETKRCKFLTCSQFCQNTPRGPNCFCRQGFTLQSNISCYDIDECKIYGICSQKCINFRGSYRCYCDRGYELLTSRINVTQLSDVGSCKYKGNEAAIIYSTRSSIRILEFKSGMLSTVASKLFFTSDLSHIGSKIYWVNGPSSVRKRITRSFLDGTNRENIVITGLINSTDLSVDSRSENIYFINNDHIAVCSKDGYFCTTIISEDALKGIAISSSRGLIYWSSQGKEARLSVASLNGENRKILLKGKIDKDSDFLVPRKLTVDEHNERLYWTDYSYILSITLDGTDRRVVYKHAPEKYFDIVYDIKIFEDNLYITALSKNTIYFCNKFNCKNLNVLHTDPDGVYLLDIFVNPPFVATGACYRHTCSQLCFPSSTKNYTCACATNYELSSDNRTCIASSKQDNIIIGAGNKLIKYSHNAVGRPIMKSNDTLKHITNIVYDSITGNILVADQLSDSLFSFNWESGEVKFILDITNQYIGGMDFDYAGNNLYWSNTEFNAIEIYSLKTQSRLEIPFVDQPHEIALVPEKGIMFVVFETKEKEYVLRKMNMSGKGERENVRLHNNLKGPKISLAYDFQHDRLYWTDQGKGRIDSVPLTGHSRDITTSYLMSPVSIAIMDNIIFWTEQNIQQLFWAKESKIILYFRDSFLNFELDNTWKRVSFMQLTCLHKRKLTNHDCSHGSPCSHICITTGKNTYVCECPYGMSLKEDGRTCEIRLCQKDEWRCMRTGHCIEAIKKCDGKVDCPGGEDEFNCNSSSHCANLQFRCNNGQCVDIKSRCDFIFDCLDQSDEQNCTRKSCDDGEFQCHDKRQCIMKSLVCNGLEDCLDTSDEFDCKNFTCDSDSFKCNSTDVCIPKNWECDGEIDCSDASDESEKCKSIICPEKMFHCGNENCIHFSLVCNGFDDCGDNSDETGCINYKKVAPVNCKTNEYKCRRTETCIAQSLRCDKKLDCPHGDDESNCIQCEESEFKCDNLRCIDSSLACDGKDDCYDNSDEAPCGTARQANNLKPTTASCEEYKCDDGVCISFDKICNEIYDCNDKSDEQGQCESSCNQTSSCEQKCVKTPKGPICQCIKGYTLQEDGKSCKDIDECDLTTGTKFCSQICINSLGSYKCDCYKGFTLRKDGITCKSTDLSMKFIIASNEGIKRVSFGGIATEIIVADMNDEISGLDMNIAKNTIYWSNENIKTVSRLNLTTGEKKEIFFQNPDRLAVDWATDNVYVYSKTFLASIKVCHLDKGTCANVISLDKVGNVFALIVDSVNGWIFWSMSKQTSYSKSEIYRAELTGSNPISIIKSRVTIVSGLAVDHERSRLYWCDILLRVIESCDFDGNDRKLVYEDDVYHPMQLNIFEDHLYWLSGISEKIQKCPLFKSSSEECETIDTGMSDIHKFFIIMQKSRQPFVKDRCAEHKCEHMCVLTKDGSACICEHGYPLRTNGTCTSTEPELTIVNHSTPKKYYSRRKYIYIAVVPVVIIFLGFFVYKFYFKRRFSNVSIGSLLERFSTNRTNNANLSQDRDRELRLVGSEFENPMFQDEQSPTLSRNSVETSSERRNLINKEQFAVSTTYRGAAIVQSRGL